MQNQFIDTLFHQVQFKLIAAPPPEQKYIKIQYDSRQVQNNDIFVALIGSLADGHIYIPNAIQRGAKLIIAQKYPCEQLPVGVGFVLVDSLRLHLGTIASNFYGWPQQQLIIVGVTGTNGKTTTTYLIQKILGEQHVARIGTIQYKIGKQVIKATNTTPESLDIVKICQKCVESNIRYLVMEVSSIALEMGRVDMLQFDVAVFTNLTNDHLDYHHTLDNYFKAKRKLFTKTKHLNNSVVNIDDARGRLLFQEFGGFSYAQQQATICGKILTISHSYQTIQIQFNQHCTQLKSKLLGTYNMYNTLAAVGAGLCLGLDLNVIVQRLQQMEGVPGRFECIDAGQDFTVVVDYAHTGDGLQNILKAITQIKGHGQIITVFGCGGDRPRQRRFEMGSAAHKYSSFCILTTDNPRNQKFQQIISDIQLGFTDAHGVIMRDHFQVIFNRKQAIERAINLAKSGDFVLIAGKGHETTQQIGNQTFQFNDKLQVYKILTNRKDRKNRQQFQKQKQWQ